MYGVYQGQPTSEIEIYFNKEQVFIFNLEAFLLFLYVRMGQSFIGADLFCGLFTWEDGRSLEICKN